MNALRHPHPVCVLCGRDIQRSASGRRRLYCSSACRQRAYRQRDEERLWRGSDPVLDDVEDVASLLNASLWSRQRR